jgi:ATP-dependent RNA helicase DDX10/DBP4
MKLKFNFFELYGRQKQEKRTYIFYNFLQKNNSVLFATDIASRGVDFPSVDWVIQLDCPEDMATYIHRVGRTARYKSKGNSLLFVSQGEAKLVEELTAKSLFIKKIKVNPNKIVTLKPILRSILSENPSILHLAKKAISSYVKSIHLNSNKNYFDIKNINLEELSLSFGLMMTPEMKIVKKSQNDLKNALHIPKEDEEGKIEGGKKLSKLQKLKEKIKLKKLQKTELLNQKNDVKENIVMKDVEKSETDEDQDVAEDEESEEENEDDFLKLKRKNVNILEDVISNTDEKEYQFKHKNLAKMEEKIPGSFVNMVKEKLEKNKEESKIIQKQRILDKRKLDRLKSKARDYEKHHLNQEGQNEEYVETTDEKEAKVEAPKMKLSEINNSSLENKSNLALKFIREKGLLK